MPPGSLALTAPTADLVAQYRAIVDRLLDRGDELIRALKQATRPRTVANPAGRPAAEILDLVAPFEQLARAIRSSIRLDIALGRAQPDELDPRLLAQIVAAIRRDLDAAAAALPPARGADILPFPHVRR